MGTPASKSLWPVSRKRFLKWYSQVLAQFNGLALEKSNYATLNSTQPQARGHP